MTQANGVRRQGLRVIKSTSLSRIARRTALIATVLILSSVGLGIVLLSPIFLEQLGKLTAADWSRLSEIGQTYGAVSAVLAAVAVGGVVVSLLLQARQTRAGQVQVLRQFHLELMQMELDNPTLYLPCWGPLDVPTSQGKQQHIYTNLIVSYQWMSYDLDAAPELDIRGALATMFQGEIGRRYWGYARPYWARWAELGSRSRQFLRLIDEEYQNAVAAGPPTVFDVIEDIQDPASVRSERDRRIQATSIAFGGGLLIGIILRRWRLPGEDGRHRRPPAGRP